MALFRLYLPSKFFSHVSHVTFLRTQLFGLITLLAAAWLVNQSIFDNADTHFVANL